MTEFLLFALCGMVVWVFWRAREAHRRLEVLEARLTELQIEISRLERGQSPAPVTPPPLSWQRLAPRETSMAPSKPAAEPPPIEPAPSPVRSHPPPLPTAASPPPPAPRPPPRPVLPAINWENFLGVKLFAWIAGFALFLGVAFFVKYSFEQNLISAQMRVAIGYLTGIGLLVGGLVMPRARHIVTVQTLCATGVLVLYAVTFAAHARYGLLRATPAFGLMALVTATAFLLAVRLDAQVIAILGLLGGFLTPPLLSTGVDNPPGFFGYLALLDAGLIAVTLRKRWSHLVLLAAAATVFMQWTWVAKFFVIRSLREARDKVFGKDE